MGRFRWLGGALALMFAASVLADTPIVLKFSHILSPDSPKGQAALRFKRLAEERTAGRVRVEVYPNGELFRDREELEALQRGAVQMLAPSLSKFQPFGVREFQIFDLPYLFPSPAALHAVMDGDIGKELLKKLEPKGVVGLAYWDNGFKHLSANWPLRTPADCRGLKMRVQSSKVLESQMRALNAVPVVMALSEVREALAKGAVDGTENPLSNFHAEKLHEVQKHLTLSGHGYLGYAVIVNKQFWQGLPPALRTALEQAMQDATRYERDVAERQNNEALAKIRAAGTTTVLVPSAQELESWRQALLPLHMQFAGAVGKDRLAAVYRIAADAVAPDTRK